MDWSAAKRDTLRRRVRKGAAFARPEFRQPSTERMIANGPTSPAIKIVDEATRRLIDEAIAQQKPAERIVPR